MIKESLTYIDEAGINVGVDLRSRLLPRLELHARVGIDHDITVAVLLGEHCVLHQTVYVAVAHHNLVENPVLLLQVSLGRYFLGCCHSKGLFQRLKHCV